MFAKGFASRTVFARMGLFAALLAAASARAQMDPVRRDLVQIGYSQPTEGAAPVAAYGYYYLNRPEWLRPNLTLRLVVTAPYVDGELGIRGVFGPRTDLGIGLSGGGFAYSYDEIRKGEWLRDQSFTGHGGGASLSLYHLFNPGEQIPLNGTLRGSFSYASYLRSARNPEGFALPANQPVATLRAGVRFGGQEPRLDPPFAMELSAWYEGQLRFNPGDYGFDGDRRVERFVHKLWGRALLNYTLADSRHRLTLGVVAGTSLHPDRLAAYRVGGVFTLASELPLVLPGYFVGELSARSLVLMGATYSLPLEPTRRWVLTAGGNTARINYTPGMEQPGAWNTGVGAGVTYLSLSRSWRTSLSYGYGFDAIRGDRRGGNVLALQIQIDLQRRGGATAGPSSSDVFERVIRTLRALSL
jgi:hypothetical protein